MLNSFALLGLGGVSLAIVFVILLAILVFEIAMLVSVIQNKHIDGNARILWIIGMLLIHPIVALVYYFTDYKKTK